MHNSNYCCLTMGKPMFRVAKENLQGCPFCDQKAKIVPSSVIKHFVKDSVKTNIMTLEGFSFCTEASCLVAYFKNTFVIQISDLKYSIGFKNDSYPATVCYCFDWTKEKIQEQIEENGKTSALEEIKEKVKNKQCLCEIKNPKGKCCMSDVKKTIIEIKSKLSKESI